jgi:hypothetical protein
MEKPELTHWKKEFNYDYLGSYSLLPNEERTLTIKETKKQKVKNVDGKEQECFVAYFVEDEKPMILNKTNCKMITKIYKTPFIENWNGLKIVIYSTPVKAFGEINDALRIKFVNPDDTSLEDIEALFKLKMDSMSQEHKAAVLRVTSKKEVRSYAKTLAFLKTL